MTLTWIGLALLAALGILLIVLYNRLVRDKHRVSAAWSDIDVQLKRRHDLLPKLIEAVKQYAGYEQATLERVTTLRRVAGEQQGSAQRTGLESELSAALIKIYALAEDYPDLKSNASYLDLQQQISEVERDIQFARRYYNGAVNHLNTRIESFPDLIVARALAFRPADYFEFSESIT